MRLHVGGKLCNGTVSYIVLSEAFFDIRGTKLSECHGTDHHSPEDVSVYRLHGVFVFLFQAGGGSVQIDI